MNYNANGGSNAPASQTNVFDEPLMLSISVPNRSGYVFKGWATSSTATMAEYQPGDIYSQNEDGMLYAVWKLAYTVNYNANGGNNAPPTQTKAHDEPLILSTSVPTRSGYVFKGWATSSSATSAQYHPSDSFEINANTTLYAVWKRAYNIYYSANGGVEAPETQIKIQDEPLIITSDTPIREGYSFLGWGTSSGTSVISYNGGDSYTNNTGTTLYAIWKPNEYLVTYNANGGSGAPEQEIKKHDTPLYIYTQHPVRYGYTFLGWSKDRKAEVPEYIEGYAAYTDNADVTLYAVWKLNEYTITYDANGGSNAPTAQTLLHGGEVKITSDIPTREGFEFIGWSTLRDTRNVMYRPGDTYSADEDITLYAVWRAGGTAGTDISWVLYNDGELVISGTGEITDSPWDKNAVKAITVESGITSIGVGVFKGCLNASRVILPVGLERIEDEAFRKCSSITSIVIPETVNRIGTYAFECCYSLKNITLPPQLQYIESYSFSRCSALKDIVIPQAAESIDDHAFYQAGVQEVTIFNNLYNIGVSAFDIYYSKVSYVYYTGRAAEWNEIDISTGNSKLTSANINYNYRLPAVSKPTVTVSDVAGGKQVSINSTDNNVTIYYTTDGSNATTSSNIYTGEFDIKTEGTYVINALAVNKANTKSIMTTKTVTVEKAANPIPSVLSGTFSQPLRVTLSCATPNARIYYTTDGSTPNTNSTEYTSGTVNIGQTTALKAISVLDGYVNSDISNYLYTIDFLPKLVTHYAVDTGMVYASYTGFTPEGSSERGFKYKKIGGGNYIVKHISVQGDFEAYLDDIEPGYEYECVAFDIIDINGELKEIEGDSVRFKVENNSALTLNDTYLRLYPGDGYVLIPKIEGYNASDIIWQSSDRNVVSVSGGYVKANNIGSALITASTRDRQYSAECEIAVKRKSFVPSDSIDFSEWNLAMRLSSNGNDSGRTGVPVELRGANVLIGTAALAAWKGVAREDDDVYPSRYNVTAYNSDAQNTYHLQNAYILPKRTTANYSADYIRNVKNAVINYGAVYAAFNQLDDCWDADAKSYYCDEYQNGSLYSSHAVAIIGWDDNYSKDNFRTIPPADGAFICKNSYGEQCNYNGYFYMSYYDKNIGITDETMVFPGIGNSNNYDNIYQYDEFGATFDLSKQDTIMAANVFAGKYQNEKIDAASFYTYDMATNYEIYVIPDFTGENDLYNLGAYVAKGCFDYAGYHTVKFDEGISVTGEKFAIVVKLIKPGKDVHAYIEMPVETDNSYINRLYSNARGNSGESYIFDYYKSGEWTDLTNDLDNANNCIKAFTSGTTPKRRLMLTGRGNTSDEIMTLDEVVEKGVNVNSDFALFAVNNIQLLSEDKSSELIPSTAEFGTYDCGIGTGNVYPSYYSLRDEGLVTPVRNQGGYNTCWIHGIYASLESSVLKKIMRTRETTLNGGIGVGDDLSEVGAYVPVSGLSLNAASYKLALGGMVKLDALIEPANADNRNVSWSSADTDIADVDIFGNVTAKSKGNTIITAEIGKHKAFCELTVTDSVPIERIEFVNANSAFNIGEEWFADYTIYPTNISKHDLIWSSDNENIATVDSNGLITAIESGKTIIRLTDVTTGVFGEMQITVNGEKIKTNTTISKTGNKFYVSVTGNVDPAEQNIYVAAYNRYNKMYEVHKVYNVGNNIEFDVNNDIDHFKVFVWNRLMQPLSDIEIILVP